MEMGCRKFRLGTIIKNSLFLPTREILVNAASHLRHKAQEKSEGLVILYKDMEACGGYADIQVMWEMVHSSNPPNDVQKHRSNNWTIKCWKFCVHRQV